LGGSNYILNTKKSSFFKDPCWCTPPFWVLLQQRINGFVMESGEHGVESRQDCSGGAKYKITKIFIKLFDRPYYKL